MKDHTVIVGFPGIGLTGSIVAKHVVSSLGMELVGEIDDEGLPCTVSVKNGIAQPQIGIFSSPERRITVITGDVFLEEAVAKRVAGKIVSAAQEKGAERIISVAGVVIPRGREGEIYGVCAREEDEWFLKENKILPVEKGVTTGVSAALLAEGRRRGFPVFLLLGQLHVKEDFRAAADVILKLDDMLNLNVRVDTLIEEAERIEREVRAVMRSKPEKEEMYG